MSEICLVKSNFLSSVGAKYFKFCAAIIGVLLLMIMLLSVSSILWSVFKSCVLFVLILMFLFRKNCSDMCICRYTFKLAWSYLAEVAMIYVSSASNGSSVSVCFDISFMCMLKSVGLFRQTVFIYVI